LSVVVLHVLIIVVVAIVVVGVVVAVVFVVVVVVVVVLIVVALLSLSSSSSGEGLNDPRSGLWRHVVDLLSRCSNPPEFVVLENGPLLLAIMHEFVNPMRSAGYNNARWAVCGGLVVKARHARRRAWVLFRHDSSRCREARVDMRTNWSLVAADFVAPSTDLEYAVHKPRDIEDSLERCRELGNSLIVPVARFMTIALVCGRPASEVTGDSAVFASLSDAWESGAHHVRLRGRIGDATGVYGCGHTGVMIDGCLWHVTPRSFTGPQSLAGAAMGPLLLPTLAPDYIRHRALPPLSRRILAPTRKRLLATPRWSVWRPQVFLTKRGCNDLVTQVFHSDQAPKKCLSISGRKRYAVRASWVEALMGFERHHTRL